MFDGLESPLTQTFGLGIFEQATPEHLDEIEAFFRDRNAPVFHEISPMTDLSMLSLLGERGYRPIELTSVMYRPLMSGSIDEAISNSGISTRRINESEADRWAEIAARGWVTEHESLGEFMLAFGRVAARTSGGNPFLAEIDGEAIAAAGFVGCGLFGALAPLMPTAYSALALLAPAIFLSNTPYACAGTAIQLITPNRARAQLTALYITITTLVGLAVGPVVVGVMTDYLFRDPADIRYSLSIVVGASAPVMFLLLTYARKPFRALRM